MSQQWGECFRALQKAAEALSHLYQEQEVELEKTKLQLQNSNAGADEVDQIVAEMESLLHASQQESKELSRKVEELESLVKSQAAEIEHLQGLVVGNAASQSSAKSPAAKSSRSLRRPDFLSDRKSTLRSRRTRESSSEKSRRSSGGKDIDALQRELAGIEKRIAEAKINQQKALKAKARDQQKIQEHYEDLEVQLKASLDELHDQMEEEYESLRVNFEQERTSLETRMGHELSSLEKKMRQEQSGGSTGADEETLRKQKEYEQQLGQLQNKQESLESEVASMGYFRKAKKQQLTQQLEVLNEEIEDLETKLAFINDKLAQAGGGTNSGAKRKYEKSKANYEKKLRQIDEESEERLIDLEERWKPKIHQAEQDIEDKFQALTAQKSEELAELENRYKSDQLEMLESKRDALKKQLASS